MTKVTYLGNNCSAFVHLCPETRRFIGALALCGIVHCLDIPAGLRNSFPQLLGGVVVNPIAKFPEVQ